MQLSHLWEETILSMINAVVDDGDRKRFFE